MATFHPSRMSPQFSPTMPLAYSQYRLLIITRPLREFRKECRCAGVEEFTLFTVLLTRAVLAFLLDLSVCLALWQVVGSFTNRILIKTSQEMNSLNRCSSWRFVADDTPLKHRTVILMGYKKNYHFHPKNLNLKWNDLKISLNFWSKFYSVL